jgi:molybdopterin synthase catalytic subunit
MSTKKTVFIDGAISPEKIAKSISNHQNKKNIGGHSIFLGQVREDIVGDKFVKAIEYSTYKELAEIKIHQIREDIFAKYPLVCLHIYHSIGTVLAGELCFFVFTSSQHRKPAQDACDEIVERVKSEVPIWGKEIFYDDTHQWKTNN